MKLLGKILLIIVLILLSVLLTINILAYNYYDKTYNSMKQTNNNYNQIIKSNTKYQEQLVFSLESLKKEQENKIWEYERWTKWNQEIKEIMN